MRFRIETYSEAHQRCGEMQAAAINALLEILPLYLGNLSDLRKLVKVRPLRYVDVAPLLEIAESDFETHALALQQQLQVADTLYYGSIQVVASDEEFRSLSILQNLEYADRYRDMQEKLLVWLDSVGGRLTRRLRELVGGYLPRTSDVLRQAFSFSKGTIADFAARLERFSKLSDAIQPNARTIPLECMKAIPEMARVLPPVGGKKPGSWRSQA